MMDRTTYTNFNTKIRKNHAALEQSPDCSLKQLCNVSWSNVSQKQIVNSFISSLRDILDQDDVYKVIESIFDLQTTVHLVQDKLKVFDEESVDIPRLDVFFQVLSPILLRVLSESYQMEGLQKLNFIEQEWKEALRVAIEEELYLWQKKSLGYSQ